MCKDFIRGNAGVKGRSQGRLGGPSAGPVRLTLSGGEAEAEGPGLDGSVLDLCVLRSKASRESMNQGWPGACVCQDQGCLRAAPALWQWGAPSEAWPQQAQRWFQGAQLRPWPVLVWSAGGLKGAFLGLPGGLEIQEEEEAFHPGGPGCTGGWVGGGE